MGEQVWLGWLAVRGEFSDDPAEQEGIVEDHCRGEKIEARGTNGLTITRSISDLSLTIEA